MSRTSNGSKIITDYTDRRVRAGVITDLIKRHGLVRGAEIGVDAGRLTAMLLEANPGLVMIAVDHWPADYPDGPWEKGEGPARGAAKQQWKRDKFHRVTHPYRTRIIHIDKPSVEAAETLQNGTLDFVFLDADHSYDGVMADIMAWTPKIRYGGFLLGHDYSDEHFPGVVKAVNDAFKRAEIMLMPDFIWCVRV